ncbi:biosynthetic-type acetolactate synthase large subunit, partial [Patescibacteria group bacterium]
LMTSIANSMLDNVPVVYITGQVVQDLIGSDAFQETDVIGMTMPVVKHSYLINSARDIPRILKEAFHIANSGRPGPVHLDIVKDVWFEEVDIDEISDDMDLPGYNPLPLRCSNEEIKKLDEILGKEGTRPVILAGHGVEISKAEKELLTFAETHNIPVANTLLGLGTFPQDHDLWCGMIGMHGDAVTNYTVHHSNLIIGIGCRFDDRITGNLEIFLKGKTFVHIEIDNSELGKIVPTDLPLAGDIKDVLSRANELLEEHTYSEWWKQIEKWKSEYGFLDFTINPDGKNGLLSQSRLIHMLSNKTDGEAIIASDVGRNQMWVGRFYRFKNSNSHLSSGGLGSMGYGLPAAMGAKFGMPDREVWCVCGDGGFSMNMQDMATIAEHKLNVNIAIMEDSSLGMVRQWQNLLFKGNISHSILKNPDFVKLAESFGFKAWRATTYEEASTAMDKAREIDGPCLINFVVDPDEHVYPMVPPNTPLGDQALRDEDLLQDNTQKYDDEALLQGHT